MNKLPAILYTPLVLDWSGAKLSKSLYVKQGAYSDLPSYLINYEFLKNEKGIYALDVIHKITNNWITNPYLLFRNYSIYYFMVTNRPACIPIADLSGNRLRFGSNRMKSILTT